MNQKTLKILVSETIEITSVFGICKKKQMIEYKFSIVLSIFDLILKVLFGGVKNYGRPPSSQNRISCIKPLFSGWFLFYENSTRMSMKTNHNREY